MIQSKLDRINELAGIAKERDLTPEELVERDILRKEYIDEWRRSTIDLLENTYLVDEKGNRRKLAPKDRKNG